MKKAGLKIVVAVSFVYGLINLCIGGVIAVLITPFKVGNRMSDDITKQLWK